MGNPGLINTNDICLVNQQAERDWTFARLDGGRRNGVEEVVEKELVFDLPFEVEPNIYNFHGNIQNTVTVANQPTGDWVSIVLKKKAAPKPASRPKIVVVDLEAMAALVQQELNRKTLLRAKCVSPRRWQGGCCSNYNPRTKRCSSTNPSQLKRESSRRSCRTCGARLYECFTTCRKNVGKTGKARRHVDKIASASCVSDHVPTL
jgi:hypothetical protein